MTYPKRQCVSGLSDSSINGRNEVFVFEGGVVALAIDEERRRAIHSATNTPGKVGFYAR